MALDPLTAGLDLAKSLVNLGGEFIEDKDKRNEYTYKALELANNTALTALQTKTIPWVDALVKLLLVGKDYIRPIGGALMTAFGAYCHLKQIPIDPAAQLTFDAGLPAWGVSRHVEKQKKVKKQEPLDITGL